MKTIKNILMLASTIPFFNQQAVAGDWFMPTPLKSVYSSLVQGNIQLAWQEMQLALSLQPVDEKHWEKIKQTIISRSQCGRQLNDNSPFNEYRHIRLMIQKKTNLVQQSYQLKISLDGVEKSTAVSLVDQQGRTWMSDNTTEPKLGYAEVESNDLVHPPSPGFYQLTIEQAVYPLILSSNNEQPWIKVNRSNSVSLIHIQTPEKRISCQPANTHWQWFDEEFSMIGNSQQIQFNIANLSIEGAGSVRLPSHAPNNAKWLSAVVSQSEYQGAVRVEYAQRFTIPATLITKYK
ncbi:DUF2861 family protein [Moritella sp. F3]|uniref:DUF2861 family protein n=1 Tax=Moritella sp. F3 TaxID=2718882 RepID=UPI0018E1550E|nr:DUF2861 family protein [Moritella sp. F3]GIC76737.1 hypothetical protein FMO001_14640 [Moritella sp. F1]GIC80247.1 hypothetical protein FMO003_05280 [Moritella sp. F3]